MGRFAEAKKILDDACERSGMNNPWPFAALADLATAKGEFEEAVQCWEVVLGRIPGFAIAYTKGAEAMRKIVKTDQGRYLLAFIEAPTERGIVK